MKKIINTKNAPAAVGPYSQAVFAGNTLYVSGQLPIDPAKGEFVSENIVEQAEQSLKNLKAIVEEAKLKMENIVKVTVLLSDINDFKAVNEVYAKFFTNNYPARAAYEVANLPLGAKIEIEAIASK